MSEEEQAGKDDIIESIKQRELDDLILAEAFGNSYRLLMKEITFEEMLENNIEDEYAAVLTYDPDDGPKSYELEAMINYYEIEEEYEKCIKIKEILNKAFPEITKE
tara:strand:+ start:3272 stop:3589 length:318 start_codon:yes stop_codon:yes gene_type:complete